MRYMYTNRCTTVLWGGWGSAGCENPSAGLWNVALDGTLSLPYCGHQGPHYLPLSLSVPTSLPYMLLPHPHFPSPFLMSIKVLPPWTLSSLCPLLGKLSLQPSCFCSIQILWVLAQGSPPSGCPPLTPALQQPAIPRMRSQSTLFKIVFGHSPHGTS